MKPLLCAWSKLTDSSDCIKLTAASLKTLQFVEYQSEMSGLVCFITLIKAHYKLGTPAYRLGGKSQEPTRKTLSLFSTEVPLVLSLLPNFKVSNWPRKCPQLSGAVIPTLGPIDVADERRKKPRYALRCRVLFFQQTLEPVAESVTENLSTSGFYCLSLTPLRIGESLTCLLKMPSHDSANDESLLLECLVRVVRMEDPNDEGSFGIGCQIESYHACPAERFAAKARGA